MISSNGRIIPFVYPKNTIVIDKVLLSKNEYGRCRFTMAHEAAHNILSKLQKENAKAYFHNEFDNEKAYSVDELKQMFNSIEWQADAMAASLLMPRTLVQIAMDKFIGANTIKVYGTNTFASKDRKAIKDMAAYLGVSFSALKIRL